jgi:hypothetical protein
MSRIPSNTEQFLSGIAAGTQASGQAAQNFQIAEQARQGRQQLALQQQQLGLEQQKMQQQGQQFQSGLEAEAENYRRLNESRERMAQAEMGQQQSQFGQKMAFDREQANLERLIGIKMKQLDMDMMRNEQEIAAMADDDPRLAAAREKRRKLQADARNLEQMMGSSQVAMQLAQGVRGDRLDEVDARLDAFKSGLDTRKQMAMQAMQNGLDYAVLNDAREGGFIKEMARMSVANIPGMQQGEDGRDFGTTAMQILGDNVFKFFFGTGDKAFAEAKATEFQKNGSAMAVQIVHNAFDLNGDAFGLDAGKKAEAAQVAADMVAKAAILAGADPQVRAGKDAGRQALKQEIAAGFGKLRAAGMGDEQISAMLEGLESVSENRVELLRTYAERDPNSNQADLLNRSLSNVGRIQDVLESVAIDDALMQPNRGKLVDHSKYNWTGVTRKARLAYGMGQNPQLEQLMGELRARGMTDQELTEMSKLLIESDPNLQFLRPEEYAQALRGMGARQTQLGLEAETAGEDIGRIQGQLVARGRLQGLSEAERRLAEIAGLAGG